MRERQETHSSVTDLQGNPITVRYYELCFPDDFAKDTETVQLDMKDDFSGFTAPESITNDLTSLRNQQLTDPTNEHGFIRVDSDEGTFSLLHPLKGSNEGIGWRVWPKKLYDGGSLLLSESKRQDILDSEHTHTRVEEGVDEAVSNLFSAGDFESMSFERVQRFWMIGIDGNAYVLINPNKERRRYDFYDQSTIYGSKFHKGYTYKEGFSDMMDCVESCKLLLFKSTDYKNFQRITRVTTGK